MTITQMIEREVERMKAEGKTSDECFAKAKQMMAEHNAQWAADRWFQALLAGADEQKVALLRDAVSL
jgi:hypothetical protein